jgi:hypothetical protein
MAGHADAKCVIYRQHRFRAIALPDNVTEKDLKDFREKMKMKETDMAWEFREPESVPDRLCFPVSRRHVVIQKAKDASDLLLKVPTKRINWAYISPEWDLELVNFLENWVPR